ncbi:hypothetical protein ACFQPA_12665 [Halomarina halobia]|uniref:CcmD family protein n=1 Tax=Halomarina halobia TaxID=3033386 RepID=A0ABD6AAP1_9EURY|nr:hypothetical protein [Halomarina sp. PSR21]
MTADVDPALYVGGVTLLFFFWVYGIVAFVRDVRRRLIPTVRQFWRGRQRLREQAQKEREREERERQLY